MNLSTVLDDLRNEARCLDRLLERLPLTDWARPTPAEGWTIAHQVAHLAHSDEGALRAVEEVGFDVARGRYREEGPPVVDGGAAGGAAAPPAELLDRGRRGRQDLAAVLRRCPPETRIRWFGPPMSPVSMAR